MEFDYAQAVKLHTLDIPFYSLIMAAMMKADSTNIEALKRAFPYVYTELERLYNGQH